MKTHVVKTTPDATLAQALDLMDLYQTGGLPVVDGEGVVVGMLTEADVFRAAISFPKREGFDLPGKWMWARTAGGEKVADWMTAPAVSVFEHAELEEAAGLMLSRGLKRVPVVTEGGKVVGTLNRVDLLQALFEGDL